MLAFLQVIDCLILQQLSRKYFRQAIDSGGMKREKLFLKSTQVKNIWVPYGRVNPFQRNSRKGAKTQG